MSAERRGRSRTFCLCTFAATGVLLQAQALGPSEVKLQPPTAQQQVIDFDIPENSLEGCTVAVYYDSDRKLPVPDSDTKINPNAQRCNRGAMNGDLSSVVSRDGSHVQFISGLRGTRTSAADGHLYS